MEKPVHRVPWPTPPTLPAEPRGGTAGTRDVTTTFVAGLNHCPAGASIAAQAAVSSRLRSRPSSSAAASACSSTSLLSSARRPRPVRSSPRAWRTASSSLRATLTVTFDFDLRVEGDGDGVEADRLDRLVEDDLVALHLEAAGGHRVGEVAGRDRAVELAGLAGLADDDEGLAVELGGDRFGLVLAIEVAGLELGALGLEALASCPRSRGAPCPAAAGSCGHSRRGRGRRRPSGRGGRSVREG